jgi:hypothetical protein
LRKRRALAVDHDALRAGEGDVRVRLAHELLAVQAVAIEPLQGDAGLHLEGVRVLIRETDCEVVEAGCPAGVLGVEPGREARATVRVLHPDPGEVAVLAELLGKAVAQPRLVTALRAAQVRDRQLEVVHSGERAARRPALDARRPQ